MAEKDLYGILGVSKAATAEEITKAAAGLTMKNHPDRVKLKNKSLPPDEQEAKLKEASALLQEVREAEAILSDPVKRNIYDTKGYDAVVKAGQPSGGGTTFKPSSGKVYTDHIKEATVENMRAAFEGGKSAFFGDDATTPPPVETPKAAAPATAATPASDAVSRAAGARAARLRSQGVTPPPAAATKTPPVQVQKPKPEEPAAVFDTMSHPGFEKVEQASSMLKDDFNYASVPIDSLIRISENLQAALNEVNAHIKKHKPS